MLTRLIVVAIGYCFGLFQTGYLLSKYVLHEDIRTKGSGNSGATNALRVFGVKAASTCATSVASTNATSTP